MTLPNTPELAKEIADLRESSGLTQEVFAKRAGLGIERLRKLESGVLRGVEEEELERIKAVAADPEKYAEPGEQPAPRANGGGREVVAEYYGPRFSFTQRAWQQLLDSGPETIRAVMSSLLSLGLMMESRLLKEADVLAAMRKYARILRERDTGKPE